MNGISKILWACDFCPISRNALAYAEELAKCCNAEIIGLHVVQKPLITHYQLPFDASNVIKNYTKTRSAKAEQQFNEITHYLKQSNINFNYIIQEGRAHEEIVAAARKEKADLIVMGGNSGEKTKLLIGSTAMKVAKISHIPVMVVKRLRKKGRISRILVPTDLKREWEEAFDFALKIADSCNARIDITHIIELYSYEGIDEVYDKMLSQATAMVEEYSNSMKKKAGNLAIYEHAQTAINAPGGILEFIRENKIDMIVMQTHARTELNTFLLGSVTEKILNQATIPVIIVHHDEK
jgi:nucleotide-binding universal stress UspA family protein